MGFMINEKMMVHIGAPEAASVSVMQATVKSYGMEGKIKAGSCVKERKEVKKRIVKIAAIYDRRQFNRFHTIVTHVQLFLI